MTAGSERRQSPWISRREAPRRPWPTFTTAWAYARHELLYLCWALMEVALIAPAALVILPWAHFWPIPAFAIWLLLVMFIPFNLSRLMSLIDVSLERQQRVIWIAFLLTVIVSLRTLLFDAPRPWSLSWLAELAGYFTVAGNPYLGRLLALFFLIVVVWWRGIALTDRRVEVTEVGLRLRLGGLVLAPVVILLSLVPSAAAATPFVLLFFLTGLVAVALTRAEQVALKQTQRSYPMQPRWVAIIFLTSLGIVLAAGLLGMALSGRPLSEVVRWLEPLWDGIFFMGLVVVTTATYLILILLQPLVWLARTLFGLFGDLTNLPEPGEAMPEVGAREPGELFTLLTRPDPAILVWVNRVALALLIAGALLLLYVSLRRYFRWRRMALVAEEGMAAGATAEGSEPGLGRRLLQRLGRWRRWRAAATVRRLYQEMCREAAERGFARSASQTPYEYVPALDETWPEGGPEVRQITEAYVRVRYGELPETREEVEAIQGAWQRLKQMKDEEYPEASGPPSAG